jgi:hypothetical protein
MLTLLFSTCPLSQRPGLQSLCQTGCLTGLEIVCKTTIHADGVEGDERLRSSIEGQVRRVLGALETRIGHVHVRLYADVAGTGLYTCYIRVDGVPSGGLAMGDTAPELGAAVARAVSRIGLAVGLEAEKGRWPRAGSRRRSPTATSGDAVREAPLSQVRAAAASPRRQDDLSPPDARPGRSRASPVFQRPGPGASGRSSVSSRAPRAVL